MSRTLKALMYSFKGGAGRTVTTANVAHQLSLTHDVVVIDLDVESAGTSVLFGVDDTVEAGKCFSVQDVLCGIQRLDQPNEEFLRQYYAAANVAFDPAILGTGPDDGADSMRGVSIDPSVDDFEGRIWPFLHVRALRTAVKVIPARRMVTNADFVKRSGSSTKRFQTMLLQIEALSSVPDFMLFDSASGIQDTALLGLESADVLVIFARWSRQFMKGTIQVLKNWVHHRDLGNIQRVLIVPTAVPAFVTGENIPQELQGWLNEFRKEIKEINRLATHLRSLPEDWIEIAGEIPEANALKWNDRIIAEQDVPDEDLRAVLAAYSGLAARLQREREALA